MNGGVEVASTNSCDAASSTTGRVVMAMFQLLRGRCSSGGHGERRGRGLEDQGTGRIGGGDGDRMRGERELDAAMRVGTLGHVALDGCGNDLVPAPDEEPRRELPPERAFAGGLL